MHYDGGKSIKIDIIQRDSYEPNLKNKEVQNLSKQKKYFTYIPMYRKVFYKLN